MVSPSLLIRIEDRALRGLSQVCELIYFEVWIHVVTSLV